ncbi:MAG: hypothetical protein H6706_03265 [Myxococcales bacterium]|nr:hypothetical protein [Myxococcales bacterium]
MLAPILAACAAAHAFWVGPVEVHGPFFPKEVEDIRAAVTARLAQLPRACPLASGDAWAAVARAGRTRKAGRACAAAPEVWDLVARRGPARTVHLTLDRGAATFELADTRFSVKLTPDEPESWPAAIAAAAPIDGGGGGGGRGIGLVGHPVGVAVDLYSGWRRATLPTAPAEALAAAFAPCRELADRDPHRALSYTLVAQLAADGAVTDADHQRLDGSPRARACLLDALRAHRLPPGDARRAVVMVTDSPPAPLPDAGGITNYRLHHPPPLLDTSPFYDEPRLAACALPDADAIPFRLAVDALGVVTRAQVPGLPPNARTCVEAALRHVRFPCPDGGPTRLRGTISHR